MESSFRDVIFCPLEPNFSPPRIGVFGTEQWFGEETATVEPVQHDARIFQFHQMTRLFVDDLAYAIFDRESLSTEGHEFRMKTHPTVHPVEVYSIENLTMAFDLDQFSWLEI